MNLGFCGIIDIIIVTLALISMIIGFKKGLMHKAIILGGFVGVVALAIFFNNALGGILTHWGWFEPGIRTDLTAKAGKYIAEHGSFVVKIETVQASLDTNPFFAWCVIKFTAIETGAVINEASVIATYGAEAAMRGIALLIILIGGFIVLAILLMIAKALRSVSFIKFLDGFFGMMIGLILQMAVVTLLLFLLNLAYKNFGWTGMNQWLETDMQLLNNNFRLSKWIFNGNLFQTIINLFAK